MPDSMEPQKSVGAVPMVPPSTSEVSLRTMASDIDLMGKSGGLAGQALPVAEIQRVAIKPETSEPVGPTGVATPQSRPASLQDSHWLVILMWGIVIIVGGALLFGIGYYLPAIFGK